MAPIWSPDRSRFITDARLANLAAVWDAKTGSRLLTLSGHSKPMAAKVFSPDGRMIITASSDGLAKIWNYSDGTHVMNIATGKSHTQVLFSADSKYVFTFSDTAHLWCSTTGNKLFTALESSAVVAACISHDSMYLACADIYGVISIWKQTRPVGYYGLLFLTEVWLLVILAIVIVIVAFKKRQTYKATAGPFKTVFRPFEFRLQCIYFSGRATHCHRERR